MAASLAIFPQIPETVEAAEEDIHVLVALSTISVAARKAIVVLRLAIAAQGGEFCLTSILIAVSH